MAHGQEGPAQPPEPEGAPGPDPGRGPGGSLEPPGPSRPLFAMSQEPNIMPRTTWKVNWLADKAISETKVILINRKLY